MNRKSLATTGIAVLVMTITIAGCGSGGTAGGASSTAPKTGATQARSARVLPVAANPINNTSTAPALEIASAAVQDNVDPATKKAIGDRLQLALKNIGPTPLTGLEIYYQMTDKTTQKKEGYYQKLDGLAIGANAETTIYFDNQTGPGHYPENKFSLYRSSTNEVDLTIEVSAPGAKVATATATKSAGTGEKSD